MKFSFMTFSTPQLSLADVLDVAKRYGYDGIEPRLDAGHAHGIEVTATASARTAIRDEAARAGVELACLATSLRYADPAQKEDMIIQTHERIDLAADVGAPVIRVFGGKLGQGLSRDQAIGLLVECFNAVADHAAERGIALCMETHDDWCNPVYVASVVGRVNHPAIRVNWDILHPVRTDFATIDESFESLKPWIQHLHIHDAAGKPNGKLVPIGQGIIDHRRVLELLLSIDFEGFASGEWINWEPWEEHLPREIATLRSYAAELDG